MTPISDTVVSATHNTRLGFTPEQQKLAEEVREFADEVIAPVSYDYDRERRIPYEIIAQMGERGYFAIPFPKEYGGRGGGTVDLCIAIEQIARVDQSIAVTLEAGIGLGAGSILRNGTEEQKNRWLPDLAAGRALAGFGLTEPDAGSDAGATKTTAELVDGPDGKEWVINGQKQFITNSGSDITSLVTVTAVTGRRENGKPELSTIIVPSGTPGFEVLPSYDKVGWNTSDTHPLKFTDVRVPEANLLGERGRGYANFLDALDEGRILFAALCTGAAQGCLEQAILRANDRKVFGRKIGEHQAVAFMIARMAARVHQARLVTYDAARLVEAGLPHKFEASIAKLTTAEAAMANARDAAQVWGGYGYMNENVVARHYRDSKILEVGEGTTEVQLMVIARQLGFDV